MASAERAPLSRERIAAAALRLGDEEGLGALSMRKVGASLGVEAMSLYNHVANKDDLLDAVGDLLYGEVLNEYTPDPAAAWQDNARHIIASFYKVASAHPNMSSVMLDRPIPSVTKLLFLQACFDLFVAAGYPTKEAALAFGTVASWMTGFVHDEQTYMFHLREHGIPFTREDVPEEFHGAIEFMECCSVWSAEERLEASFSTLLAGWEKELEENGWA